MAVSSSDAQTLRISCLAPRARGLHSRCDTQKATSEIVAAANHVSIGEWHDLVICAPRLAIWWNEP